MVVKKILIHYEIEVKVQVVFSKYNKFMISLTRFFLLIFSPPTNTYHKDHISPGRLSTHATDSFHERWIVVIIIITVDWVVHCLMCILFYTLLKWQVQLLRNMGLPTKKFILFFRHFHFFHSYKVIVESILTIFLTQS